MRSIFQWIVNHPRISAGAALGISLALSAGLPGLRIDTSTTGLFLSNDPEAEYYRNVRANFGIDSNQKSLIVVVRSERLFQYDTLAILRDLSAELEKIDGVREVTGLFTTPTVRRQRESIGEKSIIRLSKQPLFRFLPEDPAALEERCRFALSHPLFRGYLVNEAGTAAAFYLRLRDPPGDDPNFNRRVMESVADHLDPVREALGPGAFLYQFGPHFLRTHLFESIRHDIVVLTPVALLVVGVLIFVFFRSFLATLLPLLTGLLSIFATLGFMGFAGFAINPVSATILVLILVVGCTEDLHLLAEYSHGLRAGLSKVGAVGAIGRTQGTALFLTALTTFLGFLTIAWNPVAHIREYAISCAAGIFLNFLITLFLVPSLFRLLPTPAALRRAPSPGFAGVVRNITKGVLDRHPLVAVGFLTVIGVAGFGLARLEVDTRYLRFFSPESSVGQAQAEFARDFGGGSVFFVTVETGRFGGTLELETLRQIGGLTDYLNQRFFHTLNLVDLLREFHFQQEGGLPEARMLPDTQEEIDRAMTFMGRGATDWLIDYDRSRMLIRVGSPNYGSKGIREDTTDILRFARENLPPDLEVRVTGELPVKHRFADRITLQLIKSLCLMAVSMALILGLVFRSLRFGLVGLLPNLFPVLITYGAMGWLGIPLSFGTFAVATVALGIAVDDTIHFMVRFFSETGSRREQLARTLSREFRPVTSSTVVLIAGFLVLVLSPLRIHHEVGFLYAIAFASALVADLFLLPLLLKGLSNPKLSRQS